MLKINYPYFRDAYFCIDWYLKVNILTEARIRNFCKQTYILGMNPGCSVIVIAIRRDDEVRLRFRVVAEFDRRLHMYDILTSQARC